MLRLLLGSLFAAIVMFLWGWVYWGVLSERLEVLQSVPAEKEVVAALKKGLPATGRYYYPPPPESTDEAAVAEFKAKREEGPIFDVVFVRGGARSSMVTTMAFGFVHFFLVGLLLGNLLWASGRPSFLGRLALVASIGFIAAVLIDASDVIWFHHPWKYHLFNGVYHATVCLLGGVPLAALVKPSRTAES